MSTPCCPECGTPLDPANAEQPCPACLLQLAVDTPANPSCEPGDLAPSATPPSSAPDLELVQRAFPHLEIIGQIGRGGMGTVFKARQPKLDRFVALKILSSQLAEKPTFAERFAREGKLLARLTHPNIVTVYDFGQTEIIDASGKQITLFYLLLEYVEGVNLRLAMKEERFSPEQAIAIVPKICEALQYAHEQGVVHRDVKPENILLDTKGRIKIADFGLGKLTVARETNSASDSGSAASDSPGGENPTQDREHITQTGQILGTPSYMAPEQFNTPQNVDHRADIYSLGVVFYELLTGELPQGSFPVPSEKTPVGTEIDEIVLKALKKNRELRQQSAEELKTEVENVRTLAEQEQDGSQSPESRKDDSSQQKPQSAQTQSAQPGQSIPSVPSITPIRQVLVPLLLFGLWLWGAFLAIAIIALLVGAVNGRKDMSDGVWYVILVFGGFLLVSFLHYHLKKRHNSQPPMAMPHPPPFYQRQPGPTAWVPVPIQVQQIRPKKKGCLRRLALFLLACFVGVLLFGIINFSFYKVNSGVNNMSLVHSVPRFQIGGNDGITFTGGAGFPVIGLLFSILIMLIMIGLIVLIIWAIVNLVKKNGNNVPFFQNFQTPATPTRFCTHCGSQVPEGSYACMNCGFAARSKRNFCYNCGCETNPEQVICTKCGASLQQSVFAGIQNIPGFGGGEGGGKNRVAAGLLALILGCLGVHKFYLGSWGWGLVYIALFFCSGGVLPFILGIIEGVLFLTMNDQVFDQRYNQTQASAFRW